MVYGKKRLIFAWIVTTLLGGALHFLYSWCPNPVTALFSPVNESIWEHVKVILWPYLTAALLLNRGRPGGIKPWLLTLQLMVALMLGLGYIYFVVLEQSNMWFGLLLYAALMALGFYLPTRSSGPFQGFKWQIPLVLTIILIVMVVLFTFYPPEGALFSDLRLAGAWYPITC